jgi:hypothetical protein
LNAEIDAAHHFEQLVSLAHTDNDEATVLFMEKFVQIQMDEIYEIGRIVKRLKFAGDNTAAIFILDEQLRNETRAHGYHAINGDVDQILNRGKKINHLENGVTGATGSGLVAPATSTLGFGGLSIGSGDL